LGGHHAQGKLGFFEVSICLHACFQIGCFTLDNAENNAVMMRELETLLMACEKATNKTIKFGFKNNHVQCYVHIINIVSLHIISTFTSSNYESPSPDNYNSADGRANANQVGDLAYETEAIKWSAGLKHNPLNHA
jgi:hypothetical protein